MTSRVIKCNRGGVAEITTYPSGASPDHRVNIDFEPEEGSDQIVSTSCYVPPHAIEAFLALFVGEES